MEYEKKPHVSFVTHANETLASYRMRIEIPARELQEYFGYTTSITNYPEGDIACFSKHLKPEETFNSLLSCKEYGIKTLFDICDDHFDRHASDFYENMAQEADLLSCNSDNMQERIYEVTGRLASVIRDPITFPYYEPHWGGETPAIIWYGSHTNLYTLMPWVQELRNHEITIVTDSKIKGPDNFHWERWMPGKVERMIEGYDIVILPRSHEPHAINKSMNRAVDAIHAGCFVITDFEEVYEELEPFIFLGPFTEGMKFYKESPEKVIEMIEGGQQYVKDLFNHKEVAADWDKALSKERED